MNELEINWKKVEILTTRKNENNTFTQENYSEIKYVNKSKKF